MIKHALIVLFILMGLLACSQNENVNQNKVLLEIKTVVILGNSIVKHSPKVDIGWTGNWGMAASKEDSDFVHLLIRDIKQRNPSIIIKYANTANFEKEYKIYSPSNLNDLKNPDLLIVKLSENVDDTNAEKDNFIAFYDQLINYIAPSPNSIKVVMDGFWIKPHVNSLLKSYAQKNCYPFVQISDLSSDVTNTAKGLYTNQGVAAHPSDKGMRMIEQRIWEKIKFYLADN